MKEHILRELTNDLRDIAIQFHAAEQLRERIAHRILLALNDDAEWWKAYEAAKPQWPQLPDWKINKPTNYYFMTKLLEKKP